MNDAVVALHPLTFLDEEDDVTIGRPGSDVFVVLPHDGAALLRRLAAGATIREAQNWYQKVYGTPVDIDDFLQTMEALGFVAGPEQQPSGPANAARADRPVPGQRLGGVLLGRPACLLYAAVIAVAIGLMLDRPSLRPAPGRIFFTSSITIVMIVAIAGQIPLLLAHEGFHALAGRRIGVHSRLMISRRLYFVVFETDLSGLLAVPRRRRYLCFLAGSLLDLVLISVFTIGAALDAGVFGRLCLALIFPIVIRLEYQFVFFIRTDLYYVLATALRCHDLDGAANALLRRWFSALAGRTPTTENLDQYSDRDRALARWYAPVKLVGIAVLLAIWAFSITPILWRTVLLLLATLQHGATDPHLADRIIFSVINLLQLALLVVLYSRERRARRAGHAARRGHDVPAAAA